MTELLNDQSADGSGTQLVVLVVVVLVAVVEVLIPGPAGLGDVVIVLSTSPGRAFGQVTAPDRTRRLPAVSVLRMSVAS